MLLKRSNTLHHTDEKKRGEDDIRGRIEEQDVRNRTINIPAHCSGILAVSIWIGNISSRLLPGRSMLDSVRRKPRAISKRDSNAHSR
jgi:hypothetical protein